ncbi:MAG: IS110 family transposase [Phycisphaeraceae bacterium]|nr:IS110 family transposase [Phycisphaeraceae bacterium]MBX3407886.1 IS110 family transposase [Phycisphaeraceae bacterium]
MENVPVFVGLDYHSKSVQVCVVDGAGTVLVNRRCGNSVLEIGAAVGPERVVQRVAIESCCGAADLADGLIADLHWSVSLAHPGYVQRMKQNPDKTDYADAKMLAELARAGLIPPVWLAPQPIRELRLLIRLRTDLVGHLRSTKVRILAVLRQQRIADPPCKRWCKRWLAWLTGTECVLTSQARFAVEVYLDEIASLQARIKTVEARLREATVADAVVGALMGIKGIGEVTAWTMRALIGRFDRFPSGKHLSRFCAVTPRNASSGQRVADSGMIKAGDPQLKTVVVEAAHRLRRYEPRWRALSESMYARGKPSSVIVGAIANRWLRGLYHQMKGLPMAA